MYRYFLLVIVVLMSCADRRSKLKVERSSQSDMAASLVSQEADKSPVARKSYDKNVSRKLVRNGTIHFETADVKKTRNEIEKLCQADGAYISMETQRHPEHRLEYHQEIRVPAARFDQLLQKIELLGIRVEYKTINTQDVTEEFIDLEARLKTKKDLEIRYRELLKLGKNVKDILDIETQIGNVRAEIESMEGRLNYLNNQVTFSTLSIMYFQTVGTNFGFGSKLAVSLRNGWENLLSFLIGLANIWPFIVMSIGMVWLYIYRKRRGRGNAKDIATEVNV